ncbi:MAG: protein kinase [Bryobacterales bacterium]|nr:protein kinase [Bryobacterales bacterium]
MTGTTISHYRILSKLGEGGMGVVYLAEDLKLRRTVALKFLAADEVTAEDRERFLREARAAATIQHPNVCPIHAVEEEDGRLFFAMAYIKGQTIRQMLEHGPMAVERAVELAQQIAAGLAAAHQQGVVHRDIKSGNVMVDEHGNAIILDFGLAMHGSGERITRAGSRVGTPAYMSPEQIQGQAVDHRTDLWSLGVLLFEMLTGRLPFEESGSFGVLFSIVQNEPGKLGELRADVPGAVQEIVATALRKNPQHRWQSAGQMAGALRRTRASLPDLDATVVVPPEVFPVRRKRLWIAVGAAMLVLGAAGAWWKLRPPAVELPAQKHLAVLPFSVIGKDEELQALADGLVETVTAQLSQVEQFQREFAVVPASEIRSRKVSSAEEARRIHGANLVVSGSCQRLAKKLQLTVSLIDAAALRVVGARTVSVDAGRLLELRDATANAVLRLLDLRLSQPAASAVFRQGETTSDAHNDYLLGRGYLARKDVPGNVDRAAANLERAVQKDPNSAIALAHLAEAYGLQGIGMRDPEIVAKALRTAERAVQVDPGLAQARVKYGELLLNNGAAEKGVAELRKAQQLEPQKADAALALAFYHARTGDFLTAEEEYKKAIRQRPIDWYGHFMLGYFYSGRGRYAEARQAYEAALKLTPENGMVLTNVASLEMRMGNFGAARGVLERQLRSQPGALVYMGLGLAYYFEHQYAKAAAAYESAIDLRPGDYRTWGNLGLVYLQQAGSEGKAEAAFRKAIELAEEELRVNPESHRIRAAMGQYWAALGNRKKALDLVAAIPEPARRPYMGLLAVMYERLGMRKEAIEVVQRNLADRSELVTLRADPELEKLWADPKFQEIVR